MPKCPTIHTQREGDHEKQNAEENKKGRKGREETYVMLMKSMMER